MAQSSGLNLVQRGAAWAFRKAFHIGDGTTLTNQKLTDADFIERVLGHRIVGRPVTDTSALGITAVWSCARIISETMGAFPRAIYVKGRNGNPQKVDHDLTAILVDSPNAEMTAQEFYECQALNLVLRGNAYAEISRLAGRVTSVYPIPACDVTPIRDGGQIKYRVNRDGKTEVLPAEKVWHVKGFGSNGLMGLSPIKYAAQAMGLALTLEQFSAQFFENGAHVGGVVTMPNWLTAEQRPTAREIVEDKYRGMLNQQKLMLLEGGMKYERISIPPEDAQFIESRGFQIKEVCRIYRMPPHMVADLDKSAFSNIEQQSQEFVQGTMLPYSIRFEQSGAKALLSPAERGKVFIRHNFDGLLRADAAGRAALYTVFVDKGIKNRNEIRALENEPYSDVQGMDDYTVQSQMVSIDKLGEAPAPAPAPAALPAPAPAGGTP